MTEPSNGSDPQATQGELTGQELGEMSGGMMSLTHETDGSGSSSTGGGSGGGSGGTDVMQEIVKTAVVAAVVTGVTLTQAVETAVAPATKVAKGIGSLFD